MVYSTLEYSRQVIGTLFSPKSRISETEQSEELQRLALYELGVEDSDLFVDKQSGEDLVCPNFQDLMKRIKPGDTLAIKSIDQLGCNYEEILEQWRFITIERKAAIVVLDMPLLDTDRGESSPEHNSQMLSISF